ncbi:FUSC family protein [Anaerosporobacter sp.]
MTFYEELQLNQAGSKKIIKNSKNGREKIYHIVIYLFKIILSLAFCIAFVLGFIILFGNNNSNVGVVTLLCILVFRNVDLEIHIHQAMVSLVAMFLVFALGSHFAHYNNLFISTFIHLLSIGTLMILGCHNIKMSNHSTLVLSYLLLYGYDVSGTAYMKRLVGLALGALLVCIVYYHKHHKKVYEAKIKDLIQAFDLHSARTQWQLLITLSVSSALLLAECFHFLRIVWVGIAAMSVLVPYRKNIKERLKQRICGNILGIIIFFVIYNCFPSYLYNNIGIIGGIGVGLSATYGWQTVFNSFGALAIGTNLFGFPEAMFFRLVDTVFGVIYGFVFEVLFYLYIRKNGKFFSED